MSFWSYQRLAARLPGLITPFDHSKIDCASYPLCVGEQAFVTSDRFERDAPSEPVISVLGAPPNHTIRIPPGQFAFLLTQEEVTVPADAIALISIKAKYKFKGLINVSGFHVDPGWKGKLLFSVYNAGPGEIILERLQALFLIVYADLDQAQSPVGLYHGGSMGRSRIDLDLVQSMTSQVFSPLMLQRQMRELQARVEGAEQKVAFWKDLTATVSAVVTILLGGAAVFAAYAPTALGVILARTIDGAGYDMKLKPSESKSSETPKAKEVDKENGAVVPGNQPKATSSPSAIQPKSK